MPIISGSASSASSSLLAVVAYGPASLTTYSVTNTAGLTALDTTNLTVSFLVPASGNAIVRFSASMKVPTAGGDLGLGLLNHSGGAQVGSTLSNVMSLVSSTAPVIRLTGEWYLTGLSAGTLGLDIAAGVSTAITANVFAMGHTGAVSDAKTGPAVITVVGA